MADSKQEIPTVGLKIVPLIADRATIERRFDTRDWDSTDYSNAAEQYEKWIIAATSPKLDLSAYHDLLAALKLMFDEEADFLLAIDAAQAAIAKAEGK